MQWQENLNRQGSAPCQHLRFLQKSKCEQCMTRKSEQIDFRFLSISKFFEETQKFNMPKKLEQKTEMSRVSISGHRKLSSKKTNLNTRLGFSSVRPPGVPDPIRHQRHGDTQLRGQHPRCTQQLHHGGKYPFTFSLRLCLNLLS